MLIHQGLWEKVFMANDFLYFLSKNIWLFYNKFYKDYSWYSNWLVSIGSNWSLTQNRSQISIWTNYNKDM